MTGRLWFGPSQALAGAGALAAAAALLWSGTPSGAMLWTFAVIVACVGYGDQLARGLGEQPSIGAAAATGLACLVVGSTVIAHAGFLTRTVELALIGAGLALCALGGRGDPRRSTPTPRGLLVFAAVAGVLLAGAQLTDMAPWFTDGVNHTMEVKRLWDTGGLGALPHQPGGLIVGEAYVALIGGAGTAGAFDTGLCATLLVLVLAGELATRRTDAALPVFLLLTIPIALNAEPTVTPVARWSGTLFHVTAWFALERALADRRLAGWAIPSALALIALRWEFAVIALPYLAAGLVAARQPLRSRWAIALITVGWLAALTALGSVGPLGAVRAIALTAAAVIATALVLPLIGTYPWRSAIGVLMFALASASLTTVLGVVRTSAHSGSQVSTLWFAAAAVALSRLDAALPPEDGAPRLRTAVTVAALTVFMVTSVLGPNFTFFRHVRLRDRFLDAVTALQFTARNGYDTGPEQAVARLQQLVPAGARIGFWGASSGALDYTRNPISDLSWQGDRFLAPLSRASLDGVAYLLLEDIEPPSPPIPPKLRDTWGWSPPSTTGNVDGLLAPIEVTGTQRLYRIKRE